LIASSSSAQDAERKQAIAEAERAYAAMVETYRECGYDLREIPRAAVASRVQLVLAESVIPTHSS
jgi:predicted ATPase